MATALGLGLNGLVIGARLLHLLLLNKLVATRLGGAALVELGEFRDFLNLAIALSFLSLGQGIIAEIRGDGRPAVQRDTLRHVIALVLAVAASAGVLHLVAVVAGVPFTLAIDGGGVTLASSLVLSLALIGLGESCFYGLVGLGQRDVANAALFFGTCVTAGMSLTATLHLTAVATAYALLIGQGLTAMAMLGALLYAAPVRGLIARRWRLRRARFRQLGSYVAIAGIGTVSSLGCVIAVRKILRASYPIDAVAEWEATWRLSSLFLLVISTTCTLFLLPKLSEMKDDAELSRLVLKMVGVTALAGAIVMTPCFLLRGDILTLAYDASYVDAAAGYGYQLAGDFFRVLAFVPAFALLVRRRVGVYALGEAVFTLCFVALVATGTPFGKSSPGNAAYFVACAAYFAVLISTVGYLGRRFR